MSSNVDPGAPPVPLKARRSAAWSVTFRGMYRLVRLADPMIRSSIANGAPGLDGVVELRYTGRRTGVERRILVTLLRVGDAWYIGHPNGETNWIRNVAAAGFVDVDPPAAHGSRFALRLLPPGPERDAVIRSTWTQQPFPANLVYRAAKRHVAAVGVYHRLEPIAVPAPQVPAPQGPPPDEGAR